MMEWQQHTIFSRPDGSYRITRNGYPFHVPNEGEWAELWSEISAWLAENNLDPTPEPQPDPPTLEEARLSALERLRLRKWEAKEAGITVNGISIDTDDKGQSTIAGAVTNVLLDPGFTAQWKSSATNEDGTAVWVFLDKESIVALARGLTLYTEACFAVEAVKQAELAALDDLESITEWLASRLDADWPDRVITLEESV